MKPLKDPEVKAHPTWEIPLLLPLLQNSFKEGRCDYQDVQYRFLLDPTTVFYFCILSFTVDKNETKLSNKVSTPPFPTMCAFSSMESVCIYVIASLAVVIWAACLPHLVLLHSL